MSAFYLLGVLTLWCWLTWLLWKAGRRFLQFGFAHISLRLVLLAVAALAWFGGSFWEAGGKKLYWDAELREMCAIDGGVRVYEKVELPCEIYDYYAKMNWILPNKEDNKFNNEYYLDSEITYIRKKSPMLWKIHHRIVRRYDQKILGESIMFARSGGDFPGPWHQSSVKCPDPSHQQSLELLVFNKKGMK